MPDGVDRRFAECMGIEVSLYHEDRLLESRLHRAVPLAQVDLLRRSVPFARDVFDQFIYSVTQYSIVEGTWDTFVGESLRYLALTSDEPANSVPPLIPPEIAATVADIMSRFRRRAPGEPVIDGHSMTTVHQQQLGEELMFALGGDHDDGVHAAGTRAYSKMMSARIGDGFVHPVVGGHFWSDIYAAESRHPTMGPHVTVLPTIAAAVERWHASPADRPRCERIICDRAHSRGWKGLPPSDGRWVAVTPSGLLS